MSIWSSWEEIPCRSYANGWSNHYPTTTGTVERDGCAVDIASIPAYCVPGHDDDDGVAVGPWLRLSVDSVEHDFSAPENVLGDRSASVVLDRDAVAALRDQLQDWLDRPEVYPK
jgi:hypothetical protein